MPKLIKAEIPMCPKCGAELVEFEGRIKELEGLLKAIVSEKKQLRQTADALCEERNILAEKVREVVKRMHQYAELPRGSGMLPDGTLQGFVRALKQAVGDDV